MEIEERQKIYNHQSLNSDTFKPFIGGDIYQDRERLGKIEEITIINGLIIISFDKGRITEDMIFSEFFTEYDGSFIIERASGSQTKLQKEKKVG